MWDVSRFPPHHFLWGGGFHDHTGESRAEPGMWLPSSANENRNMPGVFQKKINKKGKGGLFRCKTILIPSVRDKFQIDFYSHKQYAAAWEVQTNFLWIDIRNIVLLLRHSIAKINVSFAALYSLRINTGRLFHIAVIIKSPCTPSSKFYFSAILKDPCIFSFHFSLKRSPWLQQKAQFLRKQAVL